MGEPITKREQALELLTNQGRGEKQQVTSFNRIANGMQATTDFNPFKHKWKSKRGDHETLRC